MKHVIQFSGGVGSWATARIVRDRFPDDDMVLLFADTLIEDEDTYAFLEAAADNIGVPITRVVVGKTPWEVFRDERFLGNNRVDPCSKYLKRVPLREWIETHCDPDDTIVYLGIDWSEIHRLEKAKPRWEPWRVEAPLTEDPRYDKARMLRWADQHGLPRQRLYEWGMPHANCGGGCVKAGQGHFLKLLQVFPERFAEWERNEADLRDYLGKDVAILKDRRGGGSRPMTLTELRERHEEKDQQLDMFDFGGCGCAID